MQHFAENTHVIDHRQDPGFAIFDDFGVIRFINDRFREAFFLFDEIGPGTTLTQFYEITTRAANDAPVRLELTIEERLSLFSQSDPRCFQGLFAEDLFRSAHMTVADPGWTCVVMDACPRTGADGILDQTFGRILDQSYNEIFMFSARDLTFIKVNEGARRNLGYSMEEMRDLTPFDLKPGMSPWDFNEMLSSLKKGENEQLVFDTLHKRKDGTLYPVEVRLQYVADEDPALFVAIIQDVSDRKIAERTIWRQAHFDPLTGLPNREVLCDRLRAASLTVNAEHELQLIFLDLDQFKMINETEGRAVGNTILREVSERLSNLVTYRDVLARLGGDEFAILHSCTKGDGTVKNLVAEILSEMSRPFIIEGREHYSSVSIGVTAIGTDDVEPDTILRHAEIAMYQSKSKGRGCACYYEPQMTEVLLQHASLERDLHLALSRNEISVVYQPKINLRTGRITGAEALVRWTHSDRGVISPVEFIPIAEANGDILTIGQFVVAEACRRAKEWLDEGFGNIAVSVNLSAVQFLQTDLVARIADVLDATDLPPHLLDLEITETVAMKNAAGAAIIMDQLADLGCTLSLDDFGTGYSSLAYLKRFPLDRVKIDRSLIQGVASDTSDKAIVSAVVQMAKSLGLKVTAEGVETQDQVDYFKKMGGHECQGFLFYKPELAPYVGSLIREDTEKPSD